MKTMTKMMMAATVAVSALTAATAANATVTIYTTQAAFNAATTARATDTFNTGVTPGASLGASLTRTAGAYGYTVSDSATTLYGAGTAADPWLSNDTNAAVIRFGSFTGNVSAIGGNFFGSDVGGAFVASPLGLTITATDANGTMTQTLINATTTTFLGFVSTNALTSLTVQATVPASSYWATVNNLVLGQRAATGAVPEPATWGMMILGFGMIGAAARSRKVKTSVKFA